MFSLDANRGYWHGEISEEDCDKTVFNPIMAFPFPLEEQLGENHAMVQRSMDVLSMIVKCQLALVVLYAIVLFLRTPDEHIGQVPQA